MAGRAAVGRPAMGAASARTVQRPLRARVAMREADRQAIVNRGRIAVATLATGAVGAASAKALSGGGGKGGGGAASGGGGRNDGRCRKFDLRDPNCAPANDNRRPSSVAANDNFSKQRLFNSYLRFSKSYNFKKSPVNDNEIKSKILIPNVNMGKQGKHIVGHNNFISGRSELTVDPNKLAEKAGTGRPANEIPRGKPGFKERIDFGEVIGEYVSGDIRLPTNKGIMVYDSQGDIHIYPTRP